MADATGLHDWMDFSAKRLTVENPQLVLSMLGLSATIDRSEETATEQRPQRALTRRDLVMKLDWRGLGEVFLLLEFISNSGADDHARMGEYIDDSYLQGHRPLLPILIFLDRPAAKVRAAHPHLTLRKMGSGELVFPNLPAAFQAKATSYFWLVLADCLPKIEDVTPEQAGLLPFYPMLLHRVKGAELEQKIRQYTGVVAQKIAGLDAAKQTDVTGSFVDVISRWKPDLATLAEEIFMTQYKIDPQAHPWYRMGRNKGIEEGREEGREEGQVGQAHATILRLGTKRFGKPAVKIRKSIENITDLTRLNALIERVIEIESWSDLLTETAG